MRLRGLSGARDEFHLAAIVQNLKTMRSGCSGRRPNTPVRELPQWRQRRVVKQTVQAEHGRNARARSNADEETAKRADKQLFRQRPTRPSRNVRFRAAMEGIADVNAPNQASHFMNTCPSNLRFCLQLGNTRVTAPRWSVPRSKTPRARAGRRSAACSAGRRRWETSWETRAGETS
jgi:hypothetical protein